MNLDADRSRSFRRGSYEEYHPYGSTAWWAGASATVSQKRYRFTGMERDDKTGLQCHGVRYYAVWLGRWVSADPIGLGDGGTRFGYCQGKPLACHDPSGMFSLPVWAIPIALTDYSQIEALQQRLARVGLGSEFMDAAKEVSLLDPLDSDVQEWLDVNVIGYRYDSFYDLPSAKGAMAAIRDAQAAEDRGIAP